MRLPGTGKLETVRPLTAREAEILTPEAAAFVAELVREFEPRRRELLAQRERRQREIDAGRMPDFLPETASVRGGAWRVPPPPPDLVDRRVEITGPVDAASAVRALNSEAQCWMADFEDATSPTWPNVIAGQRTLRAAVRGELPGVTRPPKPILVRPRGWHLEEKHVRCGGERVAAAWFDWGLAFFHNARELVARGSGAYFYLPKMESHREVRLWRDVFRHAEAAVGLPRGSVRAMVMIETVLAAFEAEEMLFELGEYALGLNCGRWDYLFSVVKKLRNRPEYLFPERGLITMTAPLMRAYCRHVIEVCHAHGAYAMGGSAVQIPIAGDAEANAAALAKVAADKEREAAEGFDGTWVAHPGLVATAIEALARHMPGVNNLGRRHADGITAAQLLEPPRGAISEAGVRWNLHAGVRYLEAWLRGEGAEPIRNLLEELATAEISRSQLWQWLQFRARLDDGRVIDGELLERLLGEELAAIRAEYGEERYRAGRFPEAVALFMRLVRQETFAEFLAVPAYELLE